MKPSLPFLVFETTTACNLNCRYCYNIWKRPGAEDIPKNSYKLARKTLKRFFSFVDVEQVTFTGGEPFLAERFSELVLFARMKKKQVAIISNGNAATAEDYKTMISLGVGLFEFPVLSYKKEVHDFLTQVDGSWQKVLQTIKEVQELKGKIVAVIVITKANFNHIDKTLEFIKSLGINRIMLNRYNIGGTGIKHIKELVTTKEELNQAFTIANNIGKELNLTLTSNVCTPLCLLNPNDYDKIGFTSCSSGILNKPLTLDIEGNMRICNHSPIVIGNIYKNSFKEIMKTPYAQQWVDIVPGFCKTCNLFEHCLGGCRAASEQLGLSLEHVDPVLTVF
jgi:radical SAM protein with 4Fe4S-binding SPASM domain